MHQWELTHLITSGGSNSRSVTLLMPSTLSLTGISQSFLRLAVSKLKGKVNQLKKFTLVIGIILTKATNKMRVASSLDGPVNMMSGEMLMTLEFKDMAQFTMLIQG